LVFQDFIVHMPLMYWEILLAGWTFNSSKQNISSVQRYANAVTSTKALKSPQWDNKR
jgi:hypothetical protein